MRNHLRQRRLPLLYLLCFVVFTCTSNLVYAQTPLPSCPQRISYNLTPGLLGVSGEIRSFPVQFTNVNGIPGLNIRLVATGSFNSQIDASPSFDVFGKFSNGKKANPNSNIITVEFNGPVKPVSLTIGSENNLFARNGFGNASTGETTYNERVDIQATATGLTGSTVQVNQCQPNMQEGAIVENGAGGLAHSYLMTLPGKAQVGINTRNSCGYESTYDAASISAVAYEYSTPSFLAPSNNDFAVQNFTVAFTIEFDNDPPTGFAASQPTLCSGQSTTLTASCPTGTLRFYDNAGLTSALTSGIVSPSATTTYYAVCENTTCRSSSSSLTVGVTPTPAAATNVRATPTVICAGESSTLAAGCAVGTPVWYSDAALSAVLPGTVVSPAATTTYYVRCENGACPGPASQVVLTVNPLPAAPTVTPSAETICAGTTADLKASGCSGTVSWYATGSTTLLSTGATFTVNPTTGPVSYFATCTVGSCVSPGSAPAVITVVPPPTAPSISVSKAVICAGEMVTLTATNCPAPNVLSWYKDGSATPFTTGLFANVSPAESATYTATCGTTGAVSCKAESNSALVVTVNPVPATPTVTPSSATICSGQSVSLTAAGCASGETVTWSNGQLGLVIAVSPAASVTYSARCVNAATGCESPASAPASVAVSPTPTAAPSLTLPGVLCSGESVILTGSCATGTLTFYSDAALTTAITALVSPTATTTYFAACVGQTCQGPAASVRVSVQRCGLPDAKTVTVPCVGCEVTVCATGDDLPATGPVSYSTCGISGTATSQGSASINASGCLVWTAATTQSQSVTTCIIKCVGNICDTTFVTILPPVIQPIPNVTYADNDINQTPKATPVSGNLLTNDADPEGDGATVTQLVVDSDGDGVVDDIVPVGTPTVVAGKDQDGNTVPNAGTLVVGPTGSYTFTPGPTFTGSVPAQYTKTDDNTSPASATATLTIEVRDNTPAPVNDPPIANDDTNTTPQGQPVSSNVITPNDSDPDGDPLTLTGLLVDTNGDGTPDTPATPGIPVVVGGVNGDGVSVPNAGTLVVGPTGSYTFTPAPTFTGQVVSNYTISDPGSLTDAATLTITVVPATPPNQTFANDDANSGPKDVAQSGNILTNDNDPEGQTQTVSSATTASGQVITPGVLATLPSGGTLLINPNGTYLYTPAPGFVGTEVVPYSVSDGAGATDTATLYLTTLPSVCDEPKCLPISVRKLR